MKDYNITEQVESTFTMHDEQLTCFRSIANDWKEFEFSYEIDPDLSDDLVRLHKVTLKIAPTNIDLLWWLGKALARKEDLYDGKIK